MSVEFYGRQDFSNQSEFRAAPVLTGHHSGKDEYCAETGDNGQMQTNVCRGEGSTECGNNSAAGTGHRPRYRAGEAVEHELDAFISKRHVQRVKSEGERQAEEAWKESVRWYEARRREENRQAWASFHETQAERHRRTLASLIAGHEEKARKLLKSEIPSLDRPEI